MADPTTERIQVMWHDEVARFGSKFDIIEIDISYPPVPRS